MVKLNLNVLIQNYTKVTPFLHIIILYCTWKLLILK